MPPDEESDEPPDPGPAAIIEILGGLLGVVLDLIVKLVAGERQTAQQIKDALDAAMASLMARLAALPADIAQNNAIVDAELAEKKKPKTE